MKTSALRILCILASSLMPVATALSQNTYPAAPVKLVYGYAAGGGGDAVARLLATKLSAQMNSSVFVENKPGAGGQTANEYVAKSKPDGYTTILADAGVATGALLGMALNYDVFRDLAPVSLVSASPHVLVAHPSIPSNSVSEFVSYLRANPNKFAYSSAGTGSANHLSPLLFLQLNGLSAAHVPYKSGGQAIIDLVSGRVQWAITTLPTVLPMAKEKRIKVLAFAGIKRAPSLPEVPTFEEAGMPGFVVGNWTGVMVPARTPSAIVTLLNREIVRALQDADLRLRFAEVGVEPRTSTPAEHLAFLKSETERWARVIKIADIKAEP